MTKNLTTFCKTCNGTGGVQCIYDGIIESGEPCPNCIRPRQVRNAKRKNFLAKRGEYIYWDVRQQCYIWYMPFRSNTKP